MTVETRTASEGEILWRAVGACPEDSTARLVLAEWLDENPLPGRACPECASGNCEEQEPHERALACGTCHGAGAVPDRSRAVHAALHRCIATDGDPERVEHLAAACEADGDRARANLIRDEEWLKMARRSGDLNSVYMSVQGRVSHCYTVNEPRWRSGPKCTTCKGTGNVPGDRLNSPFLAADNCPACGGAGNTADLAKQFFNGHQSLWQNAVFFKWGFPWRVHVAMSECVVAKEQFCWCTRHGVRALMGGRSACLNCKGDGRVTRVTPTLWLTSVLEHHPGVLRVALTDREPAQRSLDGCEAWGWALVSHFEAHARYELPLCIHDHLRGAAWGGGWKVYGTAFEALDDLHRAVAVWGRMAPEA